MPFANERYECQMTIRKRNIGWFEPFWYYKHRIRRKFHKLFRFCQDSNNHQKILRFIYLLMIAYGTVWITWAFSYCWYSRSISPRTMIVGTLAFTAIIFLAMICSLCITILAPNYVSVTNKGIYESPYPVFLPFDNINYISVRRFNGGRRILRIRCNIKHRENVYYIALGDQVSVGRLIRSIPTCLPLQGP